MSRGPGISKYHTSPDTSLRLLESPGLALHSSDSTTGSAPLAQDYIRQSTGVREIFILKSFLILGLHFMIYLCMWKYYVHVLLVQ